MECVRHLGCFWQCVEHGVRERPVDKATTPMMLMFQGDLWKSGWAMTLARDGPVTTRVAYDDGDDPRRLDNGGKGRISRDAEMWLF